MILFTSHGTERSVPFWGLCLAFSFPWETMEMPPYAE